MFDDVVWPALMLFDDPNILFPEYVTGCCGLLAKMLSVCPKVFGGIRNKLLTVSTTSLLFEEVKLPVDPNILIGLGGVAGVPPKKLSS